MYNISADFYNFMVNGGARAPPLATVLYFTLDSYFSRKKKYACVVITFVNRNAALKYHDEKFHILMKLDVTF